MKVTRLPDVEPRPRRVAVGTFDGVHLGHREVIRGSDAVLTFDPHPLSVIAPAAAPRLLTTLERKAELVAGLGVDELVVVPFDEEFASRSAERFVDEVLVGALGATRVSVGENFRFGHGAKGDPEMLQADARFETRVAPLLEVDGEVVSSSHIRGLVLGGAVEYADQLLGAPFTVTSEVVHGDKPGHGVYACRATTADGRTYPAATNVGVRPMFETGRGELIEAFLLDYSGDLYGTDLRVEFLKRLRGEKRFDSLDALIEQMGHDVDEAREIALG